MSSHHTILRRGGINAIVGALREVTDCKLSIWKLDRQVRAWLTTKNRYHRPTKPPKYILTDRFFARLSFVPSFQIEVRESKSQIRKTCYGFRHRPSGERIYLRVDPGSLVEFRVHLSGYVIGKRYLIPNIDRLRSPFRWDKVDGLVRRYARKNGIIVKHRQVREYYTTMTMRCSLAKKLLLLKLNFMRKRCQIGVDVHAEAVKALRELPRLN